MQNRGVCYRKSFEGELEQGNGGLGSCCKRRDGTFVVQDQRPAQFCRPSSCRTLGRRLPALINRGLKTRDEDFAGTTTVQMLFQFFTERVVQLFIQIVGEFG